MLTWEGSPIPMPYLLVYKAPDGSVRKLEQGSQADILELVSRYAQNQGLIDAQEAARLQAAAAAQERGPDV